MNIEAGRESGFFMFVHLIRLSFDTQKKHDLIE